MTINSAIIDDEPLAAGLLKSYTEKNSAASSLPKSCLQGRRLSSPPPSSSMPSKVTRCQH